MIHTNPHTSLLHLVPSAVARRGEAELSGCWAKLLVLGLALLFLGKQETVEPTLEVCSEWAAVGQDHGPHAP